MATPLYDVTIVGGGPGGCATALSLHRSNPAISFLLLDDADTTSFKIGESLPAVAAHTLSYLSPALSERLLQDTSLGNHTRSTGTASAWTSPQLHEQYAITNPFGSNCHLDRAMFDESLRDAVRDVCKDSDKTTTRIPSAIVRARFASVEKQGGIWYSHAEHLDSRGTDCYRSKWLVDATGRKALVACKLGAKTVRTDSLLAFYSLFISANVDDDHRTLIEATDSGWWYSSQLSRNRRVVVYHTDDRDTSAKVARKEEGFLDLLYNHTSHISQTILKSDYHLPPGSKFPRCTSASSSILQPFCDGVERWCAVGDAAIAFDPLSSQGIITALNAGRFVGDMVAKRVVMDSVGEDEQMHVISDYFDNVRQKYEKERKYYYKQVWRDGRFWEEKRV